MGRYDDREHRPWTGGSQYSLFSDKVFKRETTVGGLCRAHQVNGFTFDQTGHVLHCKSAVVRRLVEKLLGNTLMSHSRRSAIYSAHVHGERDTAKKWELYAKVTLT